MSDFDRNKIKDVVIETVKESLGLTDDSVTVDGDSNLVDDLGADSLDSVEIVMALEEKFDVEIDEEEQTSISTINDIVNLVCKEKSIA